MRHQWSSLRGLLDRCRAIRSKQLPEADENTLYDAMAAAKRAAWRRLSRSGFSDKRPPDDSTARNSGQNADRHPTGS